jgi:hypothetical protein
MSGGAELPNVKNMNPGSSLEAMRLPTTRSCATAMMPFQIGSIATPDEARRFVAIVTQERMVIGALKFERRDYASSYFVAKIWNGSDETLSCTIAGWTRSGMVSVSPGHFWMNPQSVAQIPIRVPLRFPQRLRALSLHMQTPSVRASAEADVPAPLLVRLAQGLVAAGALLLAGATALHANRPQIEAYALPAHVAAGDRATASYALSGIGTARYDVMSDGVKIASGSLDSGSGSFSFPTPRHAANYRVLLSMAGPLGTVRRELDVSALPAGAARSASIEALQPEPAVVHSGEKIQVRYIAHARKGTVTLFDTSNIPLGRAPYSPSGISTLAAPNVDTPTQYRVALVVAQGPSSAQASAGLLVLPKPGVKPAPNPTPIPGVLTAAQVFRIEPKFVGSAGSFAVRVLRHPRNLRLTVEDERGMRIEGASVSARQSSVRFAAPRVDRDTSLVIVATFSRGNDAQTLLQPLVVHATR